MGRHYTPRRRDFATSDAFVWTRWRMENPLSRETQFPLALEREGFIHTYDRLDGRVRSENGTIVEGE